MLLVLLTHHLHILRLDSLSFFCCANFSSSSPARLAPRSLTIVNITSALVLRRFSILHTGRPDPTAFDTHRLATRRNLDYESRFGSGNCDNVLWIGDMESTSITIISQKRQLGSA
ncbi:hypothetical protein PILCRDRAFT_11558 [Piloderma croceum F 1598]|uniref:Uncharacterized protein n=1 Tax=Piloderma croceum (strain F 1598) TaxID=765440 RepID=A0A0C3F040_PILCF|nr:hypothetical protein PILCRDRAFT_11558 [Piloderma croceum F 1598]